MSDQDANGSAAERGRSKLQLDGRYLALLHQQIFDTAKGVQDGSIGIVEAARVLSTIGFELEADDDEAFQYFLEIDSDTDHYPLGAVRAHWSEAALAREDARRARYENGKRAAALKNCALLIEKYAPAAG